MYSANSLTKHIYIYIIILYNIIRKLFHTQQSFPYWIKGAAHQSTAFPSPTPQWLGEPSVFLHGRKRRQGWGRWPGSPPNQISTIVECFGCGPHKRAANVASVSQPTHLSSWCMFSIPVYDNIYGMTRLSLTPTLQTMSKYNYKHFPCRVSHSHISHRLRKTVPSPMCMSDAIDWCLHAHTWRGGGGYNY